MGVRVGQPVKKSITVLQMVQFGLANAQASSLLLLGCAQGSVKCTDCWAPGLASRKHTKCLAACEPIECSAWHSEIAASTFTADLRTASS